MSWIQKSAQHKQETELLRQWRRSRLQGRLENLPLELLLRRQLRRMEAIEEDDLAKTGSLPVLRKLTRLIVKKIGMINACLVRQPLKWLSRRPSLQPLRRSLVQLRRRLLISALMLLVRILRRSLGNPRP